MRLFGFLKGPDINKGIEEFKATPGAILVDVRTREEYGEGHIPGSINYPLDELESFSTAYLEKDTPFFIYCFSGRRSSHATCTLKQSGYTNVQNIGGIGSYRGKVEK